MTALKWTPNRIPKTADKSLALMNPEEIKKAAYFHKSFPRYNRTPLTALKHLAEYLKVNSIHIKDESSRFGLNAFKSLGGTFAMANVLAETAGTDISQSTFKTFSSADFRNSCEQKTFFTATDGNHGRGVAWAAKVFNQKAVVYMPEGSSTSRVNNILAEGAEASITNLNYDDCVRLAAEKAASTPDGVLIQDTAWEGYEKIPAWIMQGYGTMAMEADEQLHLSGIRRPTHIFIQAGVGSLAAAVAGYFVSCYSENPPVTVIVEAETADCYYRSAVAGDGQRHFADGEMKTIMAGLACGEPSTIAFDILRNHADAFIVAQNNVAAKGMRILAAPIKGDPQIISGESGAVTAGVLTEIMTENRYRELRRHLKLGRDSDVLLFSTEGDTDKAIYKSIVWEGKYHS